MRTHLAAAFAAATQHAASHIHTLTPSPCLGMGQGRHDAPQTARGRPLDHPWAFVPHPLLMHGMVGFEHPGRLPGLPGSRNRGYGTPRYES